MKASRDDVHWNCVRCVQCRNAGTASTDLTRKSDVEQCCWLAWELALLCVRRGTTRSERWRRVVREARNVSTGRRDWRTWELRGVLSYSVASSCRCWLQHKVTRWRSSGIQCRTRCGAWRRAVRLSIRAPLSRNLVNSRQVSHAASLRRSSRSWSCTDQRSAMSWEFEGNSNSHLRTEYSRSANSSYNVIVLNKVNTMYPMYSRYPYVCIYDGIFFSFADELMWMWQLKYFYLNNIILALTFNQ